MRLPTFGGSPVRDEVARLGAEFESLRQMESARMQRYAQYRAENARVRTNNIDTEVADFTDYRRRRTVSSEPTRHRIEIPLGMAMTVKHSYRIAGRLPDVVVDRREESAVERYRSDVMEKIVWAIFRESRGETQIASAAWDGSQLGSSCFDLYFDIDKQIPMFRACDPAGIFCIKGVDDPHDFHRVYKMWDVPLSSVVIDYGDKLFRDGPVDVQAVTSTHKNGETEMVTLVQMCDRERMVRFASGSNVPLFEYRHDYGFCPYVIIPNVGPERDIWGWADYEFVRSIALYITALFSREADILRSVSNGAVIEKGTGQNPEMIRQIIGKGGVLSSKREGSVEPIQAADVPSFEIEHAQRAMEMLKMVGFAPDAAWGAGGAGTGADRGLQLQPLLELTAMKQTNWQAGLSRLFGMAYQMIEQKMAAPATYRGAKMGQGHRRLPFVFQLGPDQAPLSVGNPAFDGSPMGALEPELLDLPRRPKELFDGDYAVRFIWQNRIDPDDPAYVLSELNKFQQGAQSLTTTLERLGFQSPEDEMKLIEKEAERFPWLRQGQIALIEAQLRAQGQADSQGQGGGGSAPDQAGRLGTATGMTQNKDGAAMGADAGAAALGAPGPSYGGA